MNRLIYRILLAAVLCIGLMSTAQAENPRVLMKTSLGDMEVELFADKAPLSVTNFLRYTDEGYYNGTIFHRVINSFMIQGGGFDADMVKKQGHAPIRNEAKNGMKNVRGSLAMARTGEPHSATSQFFINHADNDRLDYPSFDNWGYAVFGQVTKGMDTLDKIADVYTVTRRGMKNVPEKPIVLESVTRIDKKP